MQNTVANIPAMLATAISRHSDGHLIEAKHAYQEILMLDAQHHEAMHLLGVTFHQNGENELAVATIRRAIEISPDRAHYHSNLGLAFQSMGKNQEARESFLAAIRLNPDLANAHYNLGNALKDMGSLEEAAISYRMAIRIDPEFADAYFNLGSVLLQLRDGARLDEALIAFNLSTRINPDFAGAHFNEAFTRLLLGEFPGGWRKYEWRWRGGIKHLVPRSFAEPLWNGADAKGRRILLHAEQGYGDTIQFCRYAPHVAALGADVILEVPSSLRGLLSNLPGVKQVVAKGQPLPAFDVHCPLMSLPRLFGTTLKSIPREFPYLVPPSAAYETWERRLATTPAERRPLPRIGVAWAGNPGFENDINRSIKLQELLPLILNANFQFFSLQKDLREGDANILSTVPGIADLGTELVDFSETAAVIANLDLVICVDTAVAHLAAALGKPVWVMLPFAADFRWLLGRDDSPWYPTVRLFRQPVPGDWSAVLANIKAGLFKEFGGDKE